MRLTIREFLDICLKSEKYYRNLIEAKKDNEDSVRLSFEEMEQNIAEISNVVERLKIEHVLFDSNNNNGISDIEIAQWINNLTINSDKDILLKAFRGAKYIIRKDKDEFKRQAILLEEELQTIDNIQLVLDTINRLKEK